ncbi:MAG TPA: recombinase family protein [Telluria sp.]|nr:recombinase family protein [Telluria sp.]
MAKGAIRILDLAIDTATPSGRLTFKLFASIAQFERENMHETGNCKRLRILHVGPQAA